jgi:hypothetical protein
MNANRRSAARLSLHHPLDATRDRAPLRPITVVCTSAQTA